MPSSAKVKVSGAMSSLTTDMAILLRACCPESTAVFGSRSLGRRDPCVLSCPDLIRASIALQKGWVAGSSPAMTAVLPVLVRAHQIVKSLEQIMRVARAGRGLRMILHREHRLAVELYAAIGAVEQRDVRLRRSGRQRLLIHGKTMVHRGDFHLACGLVLDRMIGAVMALMHLPGLGADRQAQHLMAQTNTKRRRPRIDDLLDHRHGVFAGRRGIA